MAMDDPYPDIHHKMSKKIAQLTKVIYHLNTRNEDRDAEISQLNKRHESEVESILKDAAAKLSKFKEALEAVKAKARSDATAEKWKQRLETEKSMATKEFKQFKLSSQERESALQQQYGQKIEGLQSEVATVRDGFRKKLDALVAKIKSLETSASSSSSALEDLKQKHQSEVEDLVQSSNKKYNEMLASRLAAEDELREQLEREKVAALSDQEAKFNEVIDRLKRDAASSSAALQSSKDEQLQDLSSQLQASQARNSEQEALIKALMKEKGELESSCEEMSSKNTELTAEIARLEQQLAEARAAAEREAALHEEQTQSQAGTWSGVNCNVCNCAEMIRFRAVNGAHRQCAAC